jgi:hypothetical protein
VLEHADRNVRINTSLILIALCESQACIDILVAHQIQNLFVQAGARAIVTTISIPIYSLYVLCG